MTNINTTFPNKPLEEKTDEIIDKLGIGFNKLNIKLSHLLEENQNYEALKEQYKILKDENEHLKKLCTRLNNESEHLNKNDMNLNYENEENSKWQNYIGKATTFSLN